MRQYPDLLSNVFFLTVVKNFVEKPFCVPENSSVPEIFMDKKGGCRMY